MLVTLLVGFVLASPASAGAERSTPAAFAVDPLAVQWMPLLDEGRQLKLFREAQLSSPSAIRARALSRTAYRGLDGSRAEQLAARAFPGLIDSTDGGPPRLDVGQKIIGYPSVHAARVDLGGGKRAVVESSMPLAITAVSGARTPIDLDLRDTGAGFAPMSPLTSVRIPKRLASGPSLSTTGVSLAPLASGSASPGVLDGAAVFYANTGPDTDTLVKPEVDGLAIDALLRSPRSPGRLSYRVGLPSGAHLLQDRRGSHAVLVIRDGKVIASVLAPSAQDALGAPVPVSMTVSGGTLVLSVSHRAGEYDYPIYVDPTIVDTKKGVEGGNWSFLREPNEEIFCSEEEADQPAHGEFEAHVGFMKIVNCPGGLPHVKGQYGYLSYTTQGESKIYEFRAKTLTIGSDVATYMALAKSAYEAGPLLVSGGFTEEWRSVAAAGSNENTALFESIATASGSSSFESKMRVAEVMISQESGPSVSMDTTDEVVDGRQNALYGARWSSATTGSWGLLASASDPGLGVSSATWSSPSALKWGVTKPLPCRGVQCEELEYSSYPLKGEGAEGLPEGEDTVEATVKDPVGFGASTGLFKVKVDNTAPHALTLTGLPTSHELNDAQRVVLTAGATDGTSPIVSSGIASIVLTLDGQQFGSASGGCTPGPCTKTGEWAFSGADFAAGQHKLAVIATDNAGNVAKEEFSVTFHHASPLALGPGTVSPTTGELSLATTDVTVPSGGGNLSVIRSYRSRHITGGASGPLGPQWGLSLGAHQSLVRIANGNMVLTNSSGQQSVFTASGGGSFTSPAGDAAVVLKEKVVGSTVTFSLTQSSAVTTFALPSGGSGGNEWVPSVSQGAGSTSAVSFAYKNEAGVIEPTQVLAPVPAGVSCGTLVKGCRALKFAYATATTATGESYSQWGDYTGRLKEVTLTAWDPIAKAMSTRAIAQYGYDKQGRLRSEWNPLATPALKVAYGYDAEGHVTAMTPAGVQPWLFEQGTISSDVGAGRILALARPAATTVAEQKTEVEAPAPVNTVLPTLSSSTPVVGVKISVATNGTWSNNPLAYRYQWDDCNSAGKECTPISGAVNQAYYPVSGDVGHKLVAQVTALNANGSVDAASAATGLVASGTPNTPLPEAPSVGTLSVWTIDYQVPLSGTGLPQMTSADVAKWGQTDVPTEAAAVFPPDEPMGWPAKDYKRANIYYLDVLDRGVNTSSPTGGIATFEYNAYNDVTRTLTSDNRATALAAGASSATVSKELDTENTYNGTGAEPGTELLISIGPKHSIKLTNGSTAEGRKRTIYKHNEGAPAEGGPYHLVTTMTEGALIAGTEEPASVRTTKTAYSSENNLGWQLRKPTAVTVDPTGLNLTHSIYYDPKTGNITETRLPAAGAPSEEQGYKFQLQIGKLGSENGQFKEPQSIAVTTTGTEYVLDSGNSRVEAFNSKGTYLGKFGSLGSENGQLKNPTGIALDAGGHIWVADTGNNRIQEFTTGGAFVMSVSGLSAPQGLALDASSHLWVVNTGASQLREYTIVESAKIAVFAQAVGSLGTGNGQFTEPQGMAVGAEGNLYVADTGDSRIEEFTSSGAFVRTFGKEGTTNGLLKKPHGITTDSTGAVWVADTANNRVQEFGPTGTFLGTFGKEGTAEGLLKGPKGVGIDPEGNAWVADTANSRAQKWTGTGTGYGAGTASAHNTQTILYTAGVNSKLAACGEHPEWANLPCQTQPAANIEGALPKLQTATYTYNYWDQIATTTDTSATTTRTTTVTYDNVGRIASSTTTSTVGTALPTVTYKYNETLGALEETSTTGEGVTKTITTRFNTLGQPTTYTDADGNVSSVEYDIDGRLRKTNDGKGTQTYTYNASTGLLTELVDSSAAGMKFTASYDVEGNILTEGFPNGMNGVHTYDATGRPIGLEYVKTTHCTEKCTWFKETAASSIHGQWLTHESNLSTQQFTYDAGGRLTQVQNTPAGKGCTTRIYNYDADSNRTSLTTRAPGTGGACATEGGTVESHTYDTADRLTDAGASYGTFGTITGLPAADAGGFGLTNSYYVDNQIQSHTQNGQTLTYKLDPIGRTRETVASGTLATTIVDHYGSASNLPAWTVNGTAEWVRSIPGIGGELAAIQTNGAAPVLQLANLHGDIIATASQSETATGLLSALDTSEYGVPTSATPPKYSWLGALGIPTELASGVAEMGMRSYVPEIGRFLQPDPMAGGSANAYGYTFGDPVNSSDPNGASSIAALVAEHAAGVAAAAQAKEEAEIAARQAAEEAAARGTAESGAREAGGLASWAAGSEYLEEEEWEDEEEEGEEEYAAYHGHGGDEAAQPQDGLFYQPLLVPTKEDSSPAGSPEVIPSCLQEPRPQPCSISASLLGKAKKFAKKIFKGAKWVWKVYPVAGRKIAEMSGIRLHWPTEETIKCATAAATLALVMPESVPVMTAAAAGFGFDLVCGSVSFPKDETGPGIP